MASRFECIITGCALQSRDLFVGGDLHEFGDVWVFNACLDTKGEAAWDHNSHYQNRIDIGWLPQGAIFERRGVFVFQRDTSLMNEAAKQYVGVV